MGKRVTPLAACFVEVVDPRSEKARRHELTDILVLAVLAVIAGAEGWEDIEEFGKQRRDWLGRFLRLPHGVPSHDTISRVFRLLKPGAFQEGCTRRRSSTSSPCTSRSSRAATADAASRPTRSTAQTAPPCCGVSP